METRNSDRDGVASIRCSQLQLESPAIPYYRLWHSIEPSSIQASVPLHQTRIYSF